MVFPCCKFPRGPASPRFIRIMEEDPQISEEEAEDREWIESLEYVIENSGRERASDLLRKLRIYSQKKGVRIPYTSNTPYVNTIALEDQPRYPGRLRDRAQHKKHHKVERHGHGGAREQD